MVEELIRTFSGEARKPVMMKGSILELGQEVPENSRGEYCMS